MNRQSSQSSNGQGSTRTVHFSDRKVQVVKMLIEDNFHRRLGLLDMARAVNLSPWRLGHLFKEKVGISPQRYLTLIRLQKARYYLETGFLSVREIAVAVGMPTASQFARAFKLAYGSSPLEHRSEHFRVNAARENDYAGNSIDTNASVVRGRK